MTTEAIRSSSTSDWNVAVQNTLLCAGAVSFLFGPVAAITCAAVNVVFTQFNQPQESWFPKFDDKVMVQIKEIWEDNHFFKIQLIMGLVLRSLGAGINQVAIQWVKNSVGSPLKMLQVIGRISIVAPLVEETIFRGFLQEKLQTLQVYLFGKEEAYSEVQKVIRVVAQAIAFGACHYHPAQGEANRAIMMSTGFAGILMGDIKEEKRNLWSSAFFHAHFNTAVVARVFLFGV